MPGDGVRCCVGGEADSIKVLLLNCVISVVDVTIAIQFDERGLMHILNCLSR